MQNSASDLALPEAAKAASTGAVPELEELSPTASSSQGDAKVKKSLFTRAYRKVFKTITAPEKDTMGNRIPISASLSRRLGRHGSFSSAPANQLKVKGGASSSSNNVRQYNTTDLSLSDSAAGVTQSMMAPKTIDSWVAASPPADGSKPYATSPLLSDAIAELASPTPAETDADTSANPKVDQLEPAEAAKPDAAIPPLSEYQKEDSAMAPASTNENVSVNASPAQAGDLNSRSPWLEPASTGITKASTEAAEAGDSTDTAVAAASDAAIPDVVTSAAGRHTTLSSDVESLSLPNPRGALSGTSGVIADSESLRNPQGVSAGLSTVSDKVEDSSPHLSQVVPGVERSPEEGMAGKLADFTNPTPADADSADPACSEAAPEAVPAGPASSDIVPEAVAAELEPAGAAIGHKADEHVEASESHGIKRGFEAIEPLESGMPPLKRGSIGRGGESAFEAGEAKPDLAELFAPKPDAQAAPDGNSSHVPAADASAGDKTDVQEAPAAPAAVSDVKDTSQAATPESAADGTASGPSAPVVHADTSAPGPPSAVASLLDHLDAKAASPPGSQLALESDVRAACDAIDAALKAKAAQLPLSDTDAAVAAAIDRHSIPEAPLSQGEIEKAAATKEVTAPADSHSGPVLAPQVAARASIPREPLTSVSEDLTRTEEAPPTGSPPSPGGGYSAAIAAGETPELAAVEEVFSTPLTGEYGKASTFSRPGVLHPYQMPPAFPAILSGPRAPSPDRRAASAGSSTALEALQRDSSGAILEQPAAEFPARAGPPKPAFSSAEGSATAGKEDADAPAADAFTAPDSDPLQDTLNEAISSMHSHSSIPELDLGAFSPSATSSGKLGSNATSSAVGGTTSAATASKEAPSGVLAEVPEAEAAPESDEGAPSPTAASSGKLGTSGTLDTALTPAAMVSKEEPLGEPAGVPEDEAKAMEPTTSDSPTWASTNASTAAGSSAATRYDTAARASFASVDLSASDLKLSQPTGTPAVSLAADAAPSTQPGPSDVENGKELSESLSQPLQAEGSDVAADLPSATFVAEPVTPAPSLASGMLPPNSSLSTNVLEESAAAQHRAPVNLGALPQLAELAEKEAVQPANPSQDTCADLSLQALARGSQPDSTSAARTLPMAATSHSPVSESSSAAPPPTASQPIAASLDETSAATAMPTLESTPALQPSSPLSNPKPDHNEAQAAPVPDSTQLSLGTAKEAESVPTPEAPVIVQPTGDGDSVSEPAPVAKVAPATAMQEIMETTPLFAGMADPAATSSASPTPEATFSAMETGRSNAVAADAQLDAVDKEPSAVASASALGGESTPVSPKPALALAPVAVGADEGAKAAQLKNLNSGASKSEDVPPEPTEAAFSAGRSLEHATDAQLPADEASSFPAQAFHADVAAAAGALAPATAVASHNATSRHVQPVSEGQAFASLSATANGTVDAHCAAAPGDSWVMVGEEEGGSAVIPSAAYEGLSPDAAVTVALSAADGADAAAGDVVRVSLSALHVPAGATTEQPQQATLSRDAAALVCGPESGSRDVHQPASVECSQELLAPVYSFEEPERIIRAPVGAANTVDRYVAGSTADSAVAPKKVGPMRLVRRVLGASVVGGVVAAAVTLLNNARR